MRKAEAIMLREVPVIPMYIYTSKTLIQPEVKKWPTNIMNYFNHYRDVYLQVEHE